jgi:hypothetical protein
VIILREGNNVSFWSDIFIFPFEMHVVTLEDFYQEYASMPFPSHLHLLFTLTELFFLHCSFMIEVARSQKGA